jgi:hypothetical protein
VKHATIAAILVCAISAPALSAAPFTREEVVLMKRATTAVHKSLRDPASGRFGPMSVYHNGDAVCGIINAKNGYGGYAGDNLFLYMTKTGQVFFMDDPTRTRGETTQVIGLIETYCK